MFLVAVAPAARSAGPVGPQHDPFYTYTGRVPLAHIRPGTVLKVRAVPLAFGTTQTPLPATQILYRTTGQLGQPTVTVTTVLRPTSLGVAPRLVEYLSFYDGLAAECDPSYTLAGGNPGSTVESQAEEEELLIDWYLTNDFIVVIPDFEGTRLDWMAGRESGYGALDAVRATESLLHFGPATPVALSGYSGGAVAGDWADELAPSYAPTVHLVGVAIGGVPVNYSHMFQYINGTVTFSAAIPGMLIGLSRAYRVDLTPYLSSYGEKVVRQESSTCIAADFGHYPGLTLARILKPAYRDIYRVPLFRQLLDQQTMGQVRGHPAAPLFMAVGNSDGRGDGVMNAADVQNLAHQYCQEGVRVQFDEYRGTSHESAGAFFEPETGAYLQAWLAGLPFAGNCSSS